MKKSIAIILSIVLLITVAMPVFAGADPSFVPDKNQWYIDSGVVSEGQTVKQYEYIGERSCFFPPENDYNDLINDFIHQKRSQNLKY